MNITFPGCFLTTGRPRFSGLNRPWWTWPLAMLELVLDVLVLGVLLLAIPLLGVVAGNRVPLLVLINASVSTPLSWHLPLRAPGRVFGNGSCPSSSIGGCLAGHWETWEAWGADPWVVQVLCWVTAFPFTLFLRSPMFRFPFLHQGHSFGRCGCRPAGEGCGRVCSLFSRLLQSSLCHSRVTGRVASCDRSLAPQPFCGCASFPYGNLSVGASIPPSGGLDGIFRSSRCLPSGSGISILSPLPEVLRGRFRPTVPFPLFQPFDGSADIYPCHGPGLLDNALLWCQDSPVLGRLARPWILVPGDCAGEGLPPLVMSRAGNPHQHCKEFLDSVSVHRLPGDEASDVSIEDFPDPQACPEALISRARIRILSAASSDFLASAPGGHVVHVLPLSGLSALHEVPSASFERCKSVSGGHRSSFLGRFLP